MQSRGCRWMTLAQGNDPVLEFTDRDLENALPRRFQRVVERFPERPAVIFGSDMMTYRQLNGSANRIAHWLLAQVGSDSEPVALLLDNSPTLIATIMGILKTGKAICLLDPILPVRKISSSVQDLQTRLILTDSCHRRLAEQAGGAMRRVMTVDHAGSGFPETDLDRDLPPESLAAIRYT